MAGEGSPFHTSRWLFFFHVWQRLGEIARVWLNVAVVVSRVLQSGKNCCLCCCASMVPVLGCYARATIRTAAMSRPLWEVRRSQRKKTARILFWLWSLESL